MYTCHICRSTYSHPGNFKQHLGKHERETGAVSLLYQQLNAQGGIQRPIPPPPPPQASSASTSSNSHLTNVLQSAFADRVDSGDAAAAAAAKVYTCEICGRSFKHPGNYKQHMTSHMRMTASFGPLPEQKCQGCGEVFQGPAALRNHLVVCEDAKAFAAEGSNGMFKCDICDENFISAGNSCMHFFTF